MTRTSVYMLAAGTSIAALLGASSAFAAQNVANPSQKGSLLIWPNIQVGAFDTIVEISNDATATVHVECEYVNEFKGRVNFDFDLTGKETASWDVKTRAGDQVNPPGFPTATPISTIPGANVNRGELVCFATDPGRTTQVAWNELTGTGTTLQLNNTGAVQPKLAYRYNAWAFVARGVDGLPQPEDPTTAFGTPGTLILDGLNSGDSYDACPVYNIANFMPNGATLGNLLTGDNVLHVSSCEQDLTQDFTPHYTKLQFTTWNSRENSFTGSYFCADSVETVPLDSGNTLLVDSGNFNYGTLRTPNARLQVAGVVSTQCPMTTQPTEATGLVAVLSSSAGVQSTKVTNLLGSETSGAGAFSPPGFVLWDVSSSPPPAQK
jgi:hypothetical protein